MRSRTPRITNQTNKVKKCCTSRKEPGSRGFIPKRRTKSDSIEVPRISLFESILEGSGERSLSTTMIFVRILNILVKHEKIGKRIVPIVPDEARTFGMEGMFRQL